MNCVRVSFLLLTLLAVACGSSTDSASDAATGSPDAGGAVTSSSVKATSSFSGAVTGTLTGTPVNSSGQHTPAATGVMTIAAMKSDSLKLTGLDPATAGFVFTLAFTSSVPKTGTFKETDTAVCGGISVSYVNSDGSNGLYDAKNNDANGCAATPRVGTWTLVLSTADEQFSSSDVKPFLLHGTLDASLPGEFTDTKLAKTPGTVTVHLDF